MVEKAFVAMMMIIAMGNDSIYEKESSKDHSALMSIHITQ